MTQVLLFSAFVLAIIVAAVLFSALGVWVAINVERKINEFFDKRNKGKP
jgi:hypothetical protein